MRNIRPKIPTHFFTVKPLSGSRILISDIEITPFVLENETRVITQRSLYKTLGITRGGVSGNYKDKGGGARLVRFLDKSGINPLITNDLRVALENPIRFLVNNNLYYGYEATVDL